MKTRHSDAINIVIRSANKTPIETIIVELAKECDELDSTLETVATTVSRSYQAVANSTSEIFERYDPTFSVRHQNKMIEAMVKRDEKRDMIQRLLQAISDKHGPDKWHIFCNAWMANKHR